MRKLNDDELDKINGGVEIKDDPQKAKPQTRKKKCPDCNKIRTFYIYSGGRAYCEFCNCQINI